MVNYHSYVILYLIVSSFRNFENKKLNEYFHILKDAFNSVQTNFPVLENSSDQKLNNSLQRNCVSMSIIN